MGDDESNTSEPTKPPEQEDATENTAAEIEFMRRCHRGVDGDDGDSIKSTGLGIFFRRTHIDKD
jgi:hypothetical protein